MDDIGAAEPPVILIAENDADIRLVLTVLLEDDAFTVITASDGQKALDIAMSRRIDLVILDLQMPNLDGTGFCRAYREHPAAAPVVLLTAAAPDAVKSASATCGAVGYIPKPFDLDKVLATVKRHVAPVA